MISPTHKGVLLPPELAGANATDAERDYFAATVKRDAYNLTRAFHALEDEAIRRGLNLEELTS